MPIPTGLNDGKSSVAVPIRPSNSVPDLTQVSAVTLDVLFPDRVTRAFWQTTVPSVVPPNVKGFESLAGQPNPSVGLLVAVHTFSTGDGYVQTGTYMVAPLLLVAGASAPVRCDARPLQVTGPFGQQ